MRLVSPYALALLIGALAALASLPASADGILPDPSTVPGLLDQLAILSALFGTATLIAIGTDAIRRMFPALRVDDTRTLSEPLKLAVRGIALGLGVSCGAVGAAPKVGTLPDPWAAVVGGVFATFVAWLFGPRIMRAIWRRFGQVTGEPVRRRTSSVIGSEVRPAPPPDSGYVLRELLVVGAVLGAVVLLAIAWRVALLVAVGALP